MAKVGARCFQSDSMVIPSFDDNICCQMARIESGVFAFGILAVESAIRCNLLLHHWLCRMYGIVVGFGTADAILSKTLFR